MLKSQIAYLDVDGVLADFEGAVFRLHNLSENLVSVLTHWDAFDEILFSEEYSWREKIKREGREFWENLPKLPWADEVFQLCKSHFETVIFMTNPGEWPEAPSGKLNWIKREFPSVDGYCITNAKFSFAGEGKFLIDDNLDWCNNFKRFGGSAFCFPRPWNGKHVSNPEYFLKQFLQKNYESSSKKSKT